MRHIISSSVTCSILHHLVKRHDIREKGSERIHVFRFSVKPLSETFLIIRRTERDIMTNAGYVGLHVKYPLFLPDFNET
jgi:hypothetical protein